MSSYFFYFYRKSLISNNSVKSLKKKIRTTSSKNNLFAAAYAKISSSQSIYDNHKTLTNNIIMSNGSNKISSSINSDLFDSNSLEILKKIDKINSISNIEKKLPINFISAADNNLNKETNSEILRNQTYDHLVEEKLNDEKRIFFDMDFENMKNYKCYFKHNNCESIIKSTKMLYSSKRGRSFMRKFSLKKKTSFLSSPKLI